MNIVVFYKQGFSNTVNIAFLGLAVSDLCCLITLEWVSVCMNPLMSTHNVPWISVEVMYLSTGWAHICFCRITSFITVYITAERYISISSPLKVKEIITPRVTTVTLCLIFTTNIMTLMPEYASAYLGWTFVAEYNRTLVAIVFTSNRKKLQGLSCALHSIFSTTSFVGVVICTVILVTKLRQTSAWRKELTAAHDQKRGFMSPRDKKMVKMIVLIASVLIACYTPGAIGGMITFVVGPEFSIKGRYINACVAAWSIPFAFQAFNSSINCVLYYRMSSKYRHAFHEMFLPFLKPSKLEEKDKNKY